MTDRNAALALSALCFHCANCGAFLMGGFYSASTN